MHIVQNQNSLPFAIQNNQSVTKICRIKYPNMVPIKIQAEEGIKILKDRFLISENITGLELQKHIQKYIEKQKTQSFYFFITDKQKHRMLQANTFIKQPYFMYKNKNGFLQIKIKKQNAF